MSMDAIHAPIQPSLSVSSDFRVSMHQVVLRDCGDGSFEEWIVTDIQSGSDGDTIVLADLEFNFHLSVSESAFQTNEFIPLQTVNQTPVWGY